MGICCFAPSLFLNQKAQTCRDNFFIRFSEFFGGGLSRRRATLTWWEGSSTRAMCGEAKSSARILSKVVLLKRILPKRLPFVPPKTVEGNVSPLWWPSQADQSKCLGEIVPPLCPPPQTTPSHIVFPIPTPHSRGGHPPAEKV